MATYFFDSQIRRFMTQFMTIFSMVDVQYGSDPRGNPILHRVPVMWGTPSRQGATIINNNSASTMPTAPAISVYISGVEYDQKRTQDPYFVDKVDVRQRTLNQETGRYETTQGNAFTVERQMPVPYTLRVTVDIWTTNEQQQQEIFEQLGVLFNPSLEIQSTDNFLDWTSLSVVYQDGLNWSSRSVPQGTGNPINITSWKFYMPIWISSPVRVKKLGMIQKIIASIHKGSAIEDMANDSLLLGTRQKITPYGYNLLLLGDRLQVLPANTAFVPSNNSYEMPTEEDNTDVFWESLLNVYGTVRPGVSKIAIENEYLTTEIQGTIDYDPTDGRLLIYDIDPDTLPSNTLSNVTSIIDPNVKWPGNDLPLPSSGRRYLLTANIPQQLEIGGTEMNWPGLTGGASGNDIIQYGPQYLNRSSTERAMVVGTNYFQINDIDNICIGFTVKLAITGDVLGTVTSIDYGQRLIVINQNLTVDLPYGTELIFEGSCWTVSFFAYASTDVQYVTNNTSGVQYRYANGGWMKSYEGYIDQGDWRIII